MQGIKMNQIRNLTLFCTFLSLFIAFPLYAQIPWTFTYGSQGVDESVRSIEGTADGGYILAANSGGHVWVLKLDSSGNVQWQRLLSTGTLEDDVDSIQQTTDGGYVLVGTSTDSNGFGMSVTRLDSNASVLWQKIFSDGGGNPFQIRQTNDGGFIVIGYYFFSTDTIVDFDTMVFKLDSSGTLEWYRRYTSVDIPSFGDSIVETSDGGYLALSSTAYAGKPLSLSLLKLSSTGDILSQVAFDAAGPVNAYDLVKRSDGGFAILGERFGWIFLMILDSMGNPVWHKLYGKDGAYLPKNFEVTPDGGYLITTTDYCFVDLPLVHTCLSAIRLDEAGDILWHRVYDMNSTLDSFYVEVTAQSDGSAVFAASVGHFLDSDLLLLKTDENGNSDHSCVWRDAIPLDVVDITLTPFEPADVFQDGIPLQRQANPLVTDTAVSPESFFYYDEFVDGILDDFTWSFSTHEKWTESSGKLFALSPTRSTTAILRNAGGCDLQTVEIAVETEGVERGKVSILAWYKDDQNFLELVMKEEQNVWVLKQWANGRVVAKKRARSNITPGVTYHVEIAFDGNDFIATIDGTQLVLPKAIGTEPFGTIGLKIKRNVASFDFVRIHP
jgi:hypothetical protein